MADEVYDLVVIGGGINGAGIAADGAGRGLKVLLAEADDLGGATSSSSSKLIHGGLRYLEHYEFSLVRKALAEREVLLAKAPHIIWPLRFIVPHVDGMRPWALMRLGLFLYDHLAARRTLPGTEAIDLRHDPGGAPLSGEIEYGFSYSDCWVDDARLVVLNAIAAREAGARVLTRTPVSGLTVHGGFWLVSLGPDGQQVAARAVVNAAGPWVGEVAKLAPDASHAVKGAIRLVKGSHIVVGRIAGAEDAYTFQNRDGRVVFALPFEEDFTLIGTTERAHAGDPRTAMVEGEEEDYLIEVANRFFKAPLKRSDVVWKFAGVRPLDDDGSISASAVSRDYRFELDCDGTPPLLHVIGGKITTYRRLAEAALQLLAPYLGGLRAGPTQTTPLPGGDLGGATFETWFEEFARQNAGFGRTYLHRLARRYGTRAWRIIEGARSERDLGEDFGAGLRAREIDYLKAEEWARTAEDVLWRRTKAGLHLDAAGRVRAAAAVQAYLDRK